MFEIAITDRVITTFDEYKKEISNTLTAAAEDFVYMGYLLRQAKEHPEVLEGTEYADYKEFAATEFGLESTQVSRFISINERYGDGYCLLPQYQGYGQSKLSEMLSLPVAVADELPQTITRAEIRDIKNDIKEEQKTSDIEVAIERMENKDIDIWEAFFTDWIKKNPKAFVSMADDGPEMLLEKCSITARVPGEGKLLLTEKDEKMTLTSLRSGEKWKCSMDEAGGIIFKIAKGDQLPNPFTEDNWETITGEEFPKIAPAQNNTQKNSHLSTTPVLEKQPEPIKAEEKPEEKSETTPKPTENASEEPKQEEEAKEETQEEVKHSAEQEEESEPEVVEASVEDAPKLGETELAALISQMENKAEILKDCIHGEFWQRGYNIAKDITRRLERILENT